MTLKIFKLFHRRTGRMNTVGAYGLRFAGLNVEICRRLSVGSFRMMGQWQVKRVA